MNVLNFLKNVFFIIFKIVIIILQFCDASINILYIKNLLKLLLNESFIEFFAYYYYLSRLLFLSLLSFHFFVTIFVVNFARLSNVSLSVIC